MTDCGDVGPQFYVYIYIYMCVCVTVFPLWCITRYSFQLPLLLCNIQTNCKYQYIYSYIYINQVYNDLQVEGIQ